MSYNATMLKLLLLTLVLLLLCGCANKRGISMHYYDECREYYDLQGTYHRVCDDNLIDYDTLFMSTPPQQKRLHENVW